MPTALARGKNHSVFVGTLGSEQPGAARVYKFTKNGVITKVWGGFTGITGVAVARNGALYVSELFTGCGKRPSPPCVPGRVIKVSPDGDRTRVRVPFPAGVEVAGPKGNVFVAAWSIAPAQGAFGIPDSSGQIWRMRF